LRVVLAWVFVSSVYYAETLLSGEFILEPHEGFTHKFAKYVVCAALSALLVMKARSVAAAGCAFLMTAVLTTHLLATGAPNIFATSVLTFATMVGMTCLLDAYPQATRAIARTVVWSGGLVGCLSIVELTVLADRFIGYWAATGGVRSVSTLFNPNNLGMYLGAALLLIPWAGLGRATNIALFIPLVFGIAASGSRTAWVSLAVCLLFLLVSGHSTARALRRELVRYRLAIALLLVLAVLAIVGLRSMAEAIGIDTENRGADLYTASIRWNNFVGYLDRLGPESLLPDSLDERADLIQDNFYLVLFNIFGGGGIVVSIVLLVAFTQRQRRIPREERAAWSLLVAYFLLSGLSNSFLNSFPNNQLFFIAVGGLLASRSAWGKRRPLRRAPTCAPAHA
jgi:hypothetical protein